jgi:hypothetical protein
MARSLVIEEEAGTCSGFRHPHNGYYAGDFHRADAAAVPGPRPVLIAGRAGTGPTVLQLRSAVHHVDDPLAA